MSPRRLTGYVLLSAVAIAASVLGYYTYKAAEQADRIGGEYIAETMVSLVTEKVDRIEQQIIEADHAVFTLVDPDDPHGVETTWPPLAERISPSVRAVLVLDDGGSVLAYAARATDAEKRDFLKVFEERILPDLELEHLHEGRLKHLHRTYAGQSYLVSYEARSSQGRRYFVVAHHDTGYLLRDEVPGLLASGEGKSLYNIEDDDNHVIYGESLSRAGDYTVARRFPTTLYQWRLQAAPKQAPLLDQTDRSRRVANVSLVALSFGVTFVGILFFVYAANKERRLNDLKSELIANVSHELKTPLAVVRMFAEMLLTKRVKSEAKQAEYLEIICRESERLTALIDNVLDFSAIERGKLRFELAEHSVEDVVARAIETFRYRIEKEGTEVRLTKVGELPGVLLDDEAVLLAVINLLDNAVKYGEGSPVDVTVEGKNGNVEIRVRDHGPGIAPRDLDRVFERFYRARRNSGSKAVRGSGIGLSLVKRIAEAHGGRAWAERPEGGGALVGFSIAAREPGARPAPAHSPEAEVDTAAPAS